eukprot:31585_1
MMTDNAEKLEFAVVSTVVNVNEDAGDIQTGALEETKEETAETDGIATDAMAIANDIEQKKNTKEYDPVKSQDSDPSSSDESDAMLLSTTTSIQNVKHKTRIEYDEPQFKTWFSITCDLFHIDLNQQQYHARIRINVFWNDRHIVQEYEQTQGNKKKAKHRKSFKEWLMEKNRHHGYYLPMDTVQMKNFKNAVSIVNDIENVHFFVHKSENGNIPQMVITFDGILSEQFEMSNYPFDKQFINVRVSFNIKAQQKFRIRTTKPPWVAYKEGHDYFCLLKTSKGDALTDWEILDPWIDLHHFDQECFLIRLRLQRKPALVIVRIIVPLIIVSIAPFVLYALDVNEYADRLSILATLLLTLVAFHSLLNDSLPPSELSTIDWYIIISYVSMVVMGVGVCLSNDDNEQFPFELASYVATGIIFVAITYLFLWKWLKLTFNDRDKSWKKLANAENNSLSWGTHFVPIQKRGIFAKAKFFTS